jgi:RimJ/RimL family protein N-acetyltransferase
MALVDHWPLAGLVVRTPCLELRYPSDELVVESVELARLGVHGPGPCPFGVAWEELPSPDMERSALQHHWGLRASLRPDDWALGLVTVVDGEVVGSQSIQAKDFARRKVVDTGSWLGRAHQGRGIGTEMRAAVLHLAFAALGAERAESGAWEDNASSLTVSRRLGYVENGDEVRMRHGGGRERMVRLVLERAAWERHRRDDIEVLGLEPCLVALGVEAGEWRSPR